MSIGPEDADVRLSLSARAENVAIARHVMGAFATALGLPGRVVEDLRLAVTEACTNVVRHAYADANGSMEISVLPQPDRIVVRVADTGRGIAAESIDDGGPGLGLSMIESLADRVTIDVRRPHGSLVSMSFEHLADAA